MLNNKLLRVTNKTLVTFLVKFLFISYAISIQIIPERPEVTYWNPKYLDFLNISARRASRREPVVINLHGTIKHPWGNNITVHLVFFEYLSNVYKRSFVELRYKFCDMVKDDKTVGKILYEAGLKDLTCPYPVKTYALVNMTFLPANLPPSFPFSKGRVNISVTQNELDEVITDIVMYITVVEPPRSSKRSRDHASRIERGSVAQVGSG